MVTSGGEFILPEPARRKLPFSLNLRFLNDIMTKVIFPEEVKRVANSKSAEKRIKVNRTKRHQSCAQVCVKDHNQALSQSLEEIGTRLKTI